MRKSETNAAEVEVSVHSRWRCLRQKSLEEIQMVNMAGEKEENVFAKSEAVAASRGQLM